MKIVLILIAALSLAACQVNKAPPLSDSHSIDVSESERPQIEDATQIDLDAPDASSQEEMLKSCYLKIDEIRRFDKKQANASSLALSKAIKTKTETNASTQYISAEAFNYAMFHQNQSVVAICTQVSQKLDKLILNKVMKSSM